jgi:hypothetical protein
MNGNLYEEKKRFNTLDIVIIITAILLILLVIFRSQILSLFTSSGTNESCQVSFVCESVPKEVFDSSIKNSTNNTLTWLSSESKLGKMTIDQSSIDSARIYEKTSNGKWTYKLSETDVKFNGTVKLTLLSNNGYYVNNKLFIAPGMTITVSTELAQFDILITDITPIN